MGKNKDKKEKKDKKKKKQKNAEKLLKGHHCTGCKKACPLTNPKCKKGLLQAEAFLKKA